MRRHPDWLKVKFPSGRNYVNIRQYLANNNLHTVCEEAKCPNQGECWNAGTATFLILGDTCTRYCSYCNIKTGTPKDLDKEEPRKVAALVKNLNLRYAVITSVTRDDLADGGAKIFAETIKEIKRINPKTKVEVLTPDFKGSKDAIKTIIEAEPDVFAHNLEVVERLFPKIRAAGNYALSLRFLKKIKEIKPVKTKSGFMVGLGETKEEILKAMQDLRKSNCDILTIGQYLQPSQSHHPVMRHYTPLDFKEFEKVGLSLGFKYVHSGPLVRSSYLAGECIDNGGVI